jgi:plasmid stabilization system protein ParE
MRVSYSPQALQQLQDIVAYIRAESPQAAERFGRRVDEIARLLAEHPRAGRPANRPRVHVLPLSPFPYLLYYQLLSGRDEVRIIRVRHGARRRCA